MPQLYGGNKLHKYVQENFEHNYEKNKKSTSELIYYT